MGVKNKQVDEYIAKAAPFARPILTHIRTQVHKACPDVIEEMKWGHPGYLYHGILCISSAFKAHCGLVFWKSSLIAKADKNFVRSEEKGMGQFGRITSVDDLPAARVLVGIIKTAAALNEQGIKKPSRPAAKKTAKLSIPADLAKGLAKNKKAKATFEGLSPSHKREYVDWIESAKREETRLKRIATTLEWLAEGKKQSWRYERS
jgi:uncharacterized protein YdeI (YjbR/CyaY-like superfamily)